MEVATRGIPGIGRLKNLARTNTVRKQLPNDNHVHRAACTRRRRFAVRGDGVVLGRFRRAYCQGTIAVIKQPGKAGLGGVARERIRMPAQELLVAHEQVERVYPLLG